MSAVAPIVLGAGPRSPSYLKAGSHHAPRGDGDIMAVMDVSRARRLARGPGASENEDAIAALPEQADMDEAEMLFWSLREIPGFHRSELLEGRIVVSPADVFW